MSVGLLRPFRGFLRLRSFLSAATLAVAGTTGWVSWPSVPIPQIRPAVEDRFDGTVVLVPGNTPGSPMRLVERFAYIDPTGKRWQAEAGLETDGASIPALLHPVVGHPFDGEYLKAAIVHDAACPSDAENWRDAHLMFYHALRRCGVGETKAKVMYAAVYHFGPRWEDPVGPTAVESSPYADNIVQRKLTAAATSADSAQAGEVPATLDVRYDERKRALTITGLDPAMEEEIRRRLFETCRNWIERENPSLDEIEDWTAGMGAPKP